MSPVKPTVTWMQWTHSTEFQQGKLRSASQENKIPNSEKLCYLEKIKKGDFQYF